MDRKSINLIITGIAGGLLLSVIVFFAIQSFTKLELKDSLSLVFQVFGYTLTILALTFAALNLRFLAHEQKESNLLNQKHHAFKIITEWRSVGLKEKMDIVFRMVQNENISNLDTLKRILKEDQNKYLALMEVLNFFEGMEIAISADVANEDVLKGYFLTVYKHIILPLRELITFQQVAGKDDEILKRVIDLGFRWELIVDNPGKQLL